MLINSFIDNLKDIKPKKSNKSQKTESNNNVSSSQSVISDVTMEDVPKTRTNRKRRISSEENPTGSIINNHPTTEPLHAFIPIPSPKVLVQDIWTLDEETQLQNLISQHGNDWKVICTHFPTRTEKNIIRHYQMMLKPNVPPLSTPWTEEEVTKLRSVVASHTVINAHGKATHLWRVISQQFPNRTMEAVEAKYKWLKRQESMKGSESLIVRTPWSPEEDELLLQLRTQYGDKPTAFKPHFPQRTYDSVKERLRHYRKKYGTVEVNDANNVGLDLFKRQV